MKKAILTTLIFTSILYTISAQVPDYCNGIWRNIERYQLGKCANITSVSYECLTDSLKEKMLSVLRNEFSDEEIQTRITSHLDFTNEFITNDAWNIIRRTKRDSTEFEQIRDSLIQIRKERVIQRAKERTIDESVIWIIGNLNIKEAIPDLKVLLNSPEKYDPYTIEVVLARLGDTAYYNKWFAYFSQPFDYTKDVRKEEERILQLAYLKTQEAFYELSKFLTVDTSYHSQIYYHVGYNVLLKLKSYIRNEDFQQHYYNKYKDNEDWPYFPSFLFTLEELDKTNIEFAIQWMEENKGKYIVKP